MSGKYASDPTWASIEPIPLNDGSETGTLPLATIAYSDEYLEATSYLRAVMAANELSDRALKLTDDVIAMNPAHYTVWSVQAFPCRTSLYTPITDEERLGFTVLRTFLLSKRTSRRSLNG